MVIVEHAKHALVQTAYRAHKVPWEERSKRGATADAPAETS
jgi:hypothetical protein